MDVNRVVVLFDLDCFYAQVEGLKRPHLAGKPLGVMQKFLVVTSNYAARKLGVPKMASIPEARSKCPSIILINGEDLSPYRAASKHILSVLGGFGTPERLGLDEAYMDITEHVASRLAEGRYTHGFSGHVLVKRSEEGPVEDVDVGAGDMGPGMLALMVGSQIAAEMRHAVERHTGFQMSAGISHNKVLAKLVCGLHKPNAQTCLTASAALDFIAPLPPRKLSGVGSKTWEVLQSNGIETVEDLRGVSLSSLHHWLGERLGSRLHEISRGIDNEAVRGKGPPRIVTVEDSHLGCNSFNKAQAMVQRLAPDLVARLDEDSADWRRKPRTMTVRWRSRKNGWNFTSSSFPMPQEALDQSLPEEERASALVRAATDVLRRAFSAAPELEVVVINIGATNFSEPITQQEGPHRQASIGQFLKRRRGVEETHLSLDKGSEIESLRPPCSAPSVAAAAECALSRDVSQGERLVCAVRGGEVRETPSAQLQCEERVTNVSQGKKSGVLGKRAQREKRERAESERQRRLMGGSSVKSEGSRDEGWRGFEEGQARELVSDQEEGEECGGRGTESNEPSEYLECVDDEGGSEDDDLFMELSRLEQQQQHSEAENKNQTGTAAMGLRGMNHVSGFEGRGGGEAGTGRVEGRSSSSNGCGERDEANTGRGVRESGEPQSVGEFEDAGADRFQTCECGESVPAHRFMEHVLSHFSVDTGDPQEPQQRQSTGHAAELPVGTSPSARTEGAIEILRIDAQQQQQQQGRCGTVQSRDCSSAPRPASSAQAAAADPVVGNHTKKSSRGGKRPSGPRKVKSAVEGRLSIKRFFQLRS